MFYETSGPHGLRHNPFNALVAPRPIGWISSIDAAGHVNLAPFSYFNALSSAPPMVMYCANGAHAEGGAKDSLRNVREVPEFVANIVSFELREAMNITSSPAPHGVDEFVLAGLTAAPSQMVRPPRVAQSPVHLECRVVQIVELPSDEKRGHTNTMVIGRVIGIHIADEMVKDGMIDTARISPVARLGYLDYCAVTETFTMPRPSSRAGYDG